MNMGDGFRSALPSMDFDFSFSSIEYEDASYEEDEESRRQEMEQKLNLEMRDLIDSGTSDSEESDEDSHGDPEHPVRGGERLPQHPHPHDLLQSLNLLHTRHHQQQLQDWQNLNSCTGQKHVSRFDHDTAYFEWEIENFSVKKLPAKKDKFIESPSYKFCNIDWTFKLSRHSGDIYLTLSPRQIEDLPLLFSCEFVFLSALRETSYTGKVREPIDALRLGIFIPENKLMDNCIVDGALTVSCELRTKEFIHLQQPKTETAAIGKERSAQGHSTLAESIGSLLDDAKFSDVTLKIGEDTLRAHKAILASRSKVFHGMFESGMKESQEGVVHIAEMKPSTAEQMLQYLYTGEVEKLSMDRAMDLYSAADRFDLQELQGWCKDFIMEHVSADEVCDLVVMADLHDDEELAKVARKVFQQECRTMVTKQAWREFAKDNPSLSMDLVESVLLNER